MYNLHSSPETESTKSANLWLLILGRREVAHSSFSSCILHLKSPNMPCLSFNTCAYFTGVATEWELQLENQ